MADTQGFSRRRFLAVLGGTVTASVLAACSQQAPQAPAKTEAQPAAKPTEAAKPADKPAGAPAAAAAPTAAVELKVTPGVFSFWFNANWNKVTDETLGNIVVDWGQKNGVKVEWQSIPGSPQVLAKQSAAVAAGQPPELTNQNRSYWYGQGELADLKETLNKFKDQAGGMYPIGINSQVALDGGVTGAPYAIDVWPPQWRIDEIGKVTGGKFFETWDQLIELGPKAQQPPRTFTFAMALGHEGDHLNNVLTVLWCYGGRLCDEKGVPDIINPANKAGIETIVRMWEAKIIPPDTWAQTVTSWNNETYQKGRGLIAINPATIMGWLLVNDKELADKTGISQNPKGPAGTFAEGDAIAVNYFKKAPLANRAPEAIDYLMQPERLGALSKAVEGRFVPVYRDHAKGEFWEKSKFAEMRVIAENGRARDWPSAQLPWRYDVEGARFTVSDMMNKIINEKIKVEDAQEWAQKDMMDSYTKLSKKT